MSRNAIRWLLGAEPPARRGPVCHDSRRNRRRSNVRATSMSRDERLSGRPPSGALAKQAWKPRGSLSRHDPTRKRLADAPWNRDLRRETCKRPATTRIRSRLIRKRSLVRVQDRPSRRARSRLFVTFAAGDRRRTRSMSELVAAGLFPHAVTKDLQSRTREIDKRVRASPEQAAADHDAVLHGQTRAASGFPQRCGLLRWAADRAAEPTARHWRPPALRTMRPPWGLEGLAGRPPMCRREVRQRQVRWG